MMMRSWSLSRCGVYIVGMMRDHTGSYSLSFWLCGVLMVLAGSVILLEPCARRLDRKRGLLLQEREEEKEQVA